jgi:hypothetical protein
MKKVLSGIALVLLLTIIAVPFPTNTNEIDLPSSSINSAISFKAVEHIEDVPYVWQQLNGYCHWAAISMVLQSVGVPLDLAGVFAASGIGFATFMVRDDAALHFWPGPWVRQMVPVTIISDFYGLNLTLCIDPESGLGSGTSQYLELIGLNYTLLTGEVEAFDVLRATIDAGNPLSLWVDPYYLPPKDYDIVRELNITSAQTSVGHAIVVVGYNETAQTAQVMDPGTGACEPHYGFPSDGRWYYPINYTTLNAAWAALGYGTVIVQPGTGPSEDFDYQLVNFSCSRLLGDRASYAPDLIDESSVMFGASAFRQLSLDLTPLGLTAFLDEVSQLPTIRQIHINTLSNLGAYIETIMTIQYWAYKGALDALPQLVSDYDLTTFVEIGKQALPHFAALSHNATLTEIGPPSYESLMTITFQGLASRLQSSGDLQEALAYYSAELTEISGHISAIANVWEAAGLHLSVLLGQNPLPLQISTILGISLVLAVALLGVFIYRRRQHFRTELTHE